MALDLSASVDVVSLRPDREGRCSLALQVDASGVAPRRSGSRTVLALDVSGSMQGEPLDQVIRSVDRILDALSEEDELGIVAFSDEATRVVDLVRVDASGKRLVRSRVGQLFAESRTNIEAGLELSVEMLGGGGGVILLSDGAPNVGAHTADALRSVLTRHRNAVSFFALGYGVDHCEDVLASIGGYEFIQDPAACTRAFARALGVQADVVASEIELVIAPAEGVEIARFAGREETRFSREGVIVSLPEMVSGARRLVVAELRVRAPGARFLVDVAAVTLRARGTRSLSRSIDVEVADRNPVVVLDAARRVLLARADEARASARELADRGQFGGAGSALRKLMAEIDRLPGFRRADGSPLAEAYELLTDEATAFERKPSGEEYAALRKMMVGTPVASHVPSAAKSRGAASRKLIEHIAGDCPKAWLVSPTGARHPLGEECVIGRTAEAEIHLPDASVARRHAEVFADAGAYWLADLGSANPTFVNGTALSRTPHRLAPGDIVRVGEVELRYDEH